jgi:hypothetical protein
MANYIHTHVGKECISITIDFSFYELRLIGGALTKYFKGDYSNIVHYCQVFLHNYLRHNAPEILGALKVIPTTYGAEMCVVYIEGVNDENKAMAENLIQIIDDLFTNEEKIFTYLNQNADDIIWNLHGIAVDCPIEAVSQFWICDYVVYGLYLGDPEKFLVSAHYDYPTGPRKTGVLDSGYNITLNYNNQGIDHPVHFQMTAKNADQIHIRGGITGTNYIKSDMDANSAIQLLLAY